MIRYYMCDMTKKLFGVYCFIMMGKKKKREMNGLLFFYRKNEGLFRSHILFGMIHISSNLSQFQR